MSRLLTLVAVLALMLVAAMPAAASDTWCEHEPPVLVETPGGPVLVNVSLGVARGDTAAAQGAEVSGRAEGDTIYITVSHSPVPYTARAEIARYGLAAGDATVRQAGEPVTLALTAKPLCPWC